MQLGELANVIRSKNAGIYYITIDVMFDDEQTYEAVKRTDVLTPEKVAPLYNLSDAEIDVYEYDAGLAFKITLPRRVKAGSPGDRDLFGAQQHTPVMSLEVPDREIDR